MTTQFLATPVQLSSNITDTNWKTIDVSASVPTGATGVILLLNNRVASESSDFGVRKTGSTDNLLGLIQNGRQCQMIVGLDGSRRFDFITSVFLGLAVDLWLVGYFQGDAVFPTDFASLGALNGSAYSDINIASATGSDTATAAIVMTTGAYNFGVRKNGSTDNLGGDGSSSLHFEIVGVDGGEIFEARDGDGFGQLYLVGYMTSGISWNLNAVDRSTATAASFVAVTPQAGAGGYVYHAKGSVGAETITIRQLTQSIDPFTAMADGVSGQLSCGANAEQKISATTMDVFERGYFAGVTAPTVTDVGDESFRVGETSIIATVTNAGASQGTGFFRICPSDDINDVNGVNQTITGWANTTITFDVAAGTLPRNTNLYAFCKNDGGSSNAAGYVVQITPPAAVLAFGLIH